MFFLLAIVFDFGVSPANLGGIFHKQFLWKNILKENCSKSFQEDGKLFYTTTSPAWNVHHLLITQFAMYTVETILLYYYVKHEH